MNRDEAIWWVNHLFEIRKEEYFNKRMMNDAKEVEEAQCIAIEALQTEIVRCRDCIFYTKPHILFRDGTKRFFDSEKEIEFVPCDVGVTIGGECVGHKVLCTAHDREDPEDYEELVAFRNPNDFCSYGRCEKKMEGAEYEID